MYKLSVPVRIKEESYHIIKTILTATVYDSQIRSRHYTSVLPILTVTVSHDTERLLFSMRKPRLQRGETTCQGLHGKWRAGFQAWSDTKAHACLTLM